MRPMSRLFEDLVATGSYDAVRSRRVLLVEDDWLVALALNDMVKEVAYEPVGPAGDLATAMHLAQTGSFDAAILDYWLHEVTALQVAHILAARRIPFALATGFGADAIHKDHKAACVLSKPYTLQDIGDVLSQLLPQPRAAMPVRHGAASTAP